MQKYVVLNKTVGQTPLECMEAWRATQSPAYQDLPLTYAGRLDPLADGKLLVLIGDECKKKPDYLALDKAYMVDLLFGVSSDSGDQLGLVTPHQTTTINRPTLEDILQGSIGEITLPYPAFSAKPVAGKPLHTWAVEGRLAEIEIPTKISTIYSLHLERMSTITAAAVYENALATIERIPPVTESRKALGNDFRRPDIRASWQTWYNAQPANREFTTARITCLCSSGTYMRSLAEHLGAACASTALATRITRTKLGRYRGQLFCQSLWWPRF